MRKETVDIDILVTSRNGGRKIIRITNRPPSGIREVEPVETVQMNIYQSDIYRKDLNWLHFDDEPRELASEGPTVLHIRFCSLSNNSKLQLGAPTRT